MFNFKKNKEEDDIIKSIIGNDISNDNIINIIKLINLSKNKHSTFFYGKFNNLNDVIYYFPIEEERFLSQYSDYYHSDLIFAIYGDDLSEYKDFCAILFVHKNNFYIYTGIYSENRRGKFLDNKICKITEPEKIREAVSSLVVHEHIKEKLLDSLNDYLIKIDLPKYIHLQ